MSSQERSKEVRFRIPLTVILAAKKEFGLGAQELLDMVKRSAILSHPRGNRRFKNYGFRVRDKCVESVFRLDEGEEIPDIKKAVDEPKNKNSAANQGAGQRPKLTFKRAMESLVSNLQGGSPKQVAYPKCEVCSDTRYVLAYDECPHCAGESCDQCDDGSVAVKVPCQTCNPKGNV